MPVKTIISDIGNVVALFPDRDLLQIFGNIAREQGVPVPGDDGNRMRADTVKYHLKDFIMSHERGEIDEALCLNFISTELGLKAGMTAEQFHRAFGDVFVLNRSVSVLYSQLRDKQSLVTVAVSNLCPTHETGMRRIGAFEPFQHVLKSFEERLLKPSRELMVRALDRSGSKAEESVFIDDSAQNLEPAKEIGIRTHLYGDYRGLIDFLVGQGLPLLT